MNIALVVIEKLAIHSKFNTFKREQTKECE